MTNILDSGLKNVRKAERTGLRSFRLEAMALILCLLLFGSAPHLLGQTTSTIQGTVTDVQGRAILGARVRVNSTALGINRTVTTNSDGFYQVIALPVSVYDLTISNPGFAEQVFANIELTLNRTVALDAVLQVGQLETKVTVSAVGIQIDPTATATGQTVTPSDIKNLPINGRNYLDLLQLVPGVAINRQQPTGSDASTPILGERAGNINFMIDGLANKGTISGGPSLQLNQDAVAEFQVLTSGYKAEFGQSTAGVVNVITKGGSNEFHGSANLYVRNSAFDSADDPAVGVPALHRYDYDLNLGGPIMKDRIFFFASTERIQESRVLNFNLGSAGIPPELVASEQNLNRPRLDDELRHVVKLHEQFGHHHLIEQMSYNNAHLNGDGSLIGQSLPSTRSNTGSRALLIGATDTVLLGDVNPWVAVLNGSYRRTPFGTAAAYPSAGTATTLINFNPAPACNVASQCSDPYQFGANAGNATYGNSSTPSSLDPLFASAGASASKQFKGHNIKFGWEFLRTRVDGHESQSVNNQLFVTDCPPGTSCTNVTTPTGFTAIPANNFGAYGPLYSGFFASQLRGPLTPQDAIIRIRNNYSGLYGQNDWKVRSNLTLSLGLRWDYDKEFPNETNFSPRVGAAWSVTPNTVIRGSFGVFYDQFRLATARDIPAFGGANEQVEFTANLPQLFYNVPTTAAAIGGPCFTSLQADTRVVNGGRRPECPFFGGMPTPFFGADFLNTLPGQKAIPAGTVVTMNNVQALTGLTPTQFLANVNQAIANAYATLGSPISSPTLFWNQNFGTLAYDPIGPPNPVGIGIDSQFRTPHTLGTTIGIQHQFGQDLVLEANYYHRDIRDILGTRITNLPFSDRFTSNPKWLDPATGALGYPVAISTAGPWYYGTYDGATLSVTKHFRHRYAIQATYTYANAVDDNLGDVTGLPSDSFVGIVPTVTDPGNGKTNANGSFISSTDSYVPKAGINYNGAGVDRGSSDLALTHTFALDGLIELPYHFQFSGIVRAQRGFSYTQKAKTPIIVDGSGNTNGLNIVGGPGRNAFNASPFVNLDVRLTKEFKITERVHADVLFEAFNLFNNGNPASVDINQGDSKFGSILQRLPGREGQACLRLTF